MRARYLSVTIAFAAAAAPGVAQAAPCNGEGGYYYTNDRTRNPRQGGFVANGASVDENSEIAVTASVCGSAVVRDSKILGSAEVSGDAIVENSTLQGNAKVWGDVIIRNYAILRGYFEASTGVVDGGVHTAEFSVSARKRDEQAKIDAAIAAADAARAADLKARRAAWDKALNDARWRLALDIRSVGEWRDLIASDRTKVSGADEATMRDNANRYLQARRCGPTGTYLNFQRLPGECDRSVSESEYRDRESRYSPFYNVLNRTTEPLLAAAEARVVRGRAKVAEIEANPPR